MENSDDYISTRQAGDLIGITKRAVIDALNLGKIEGKLLSHQWIVSRASALAYAAKTQQERRVDSGKG